MYMWVGTRSAWHSKSLERRCQAAVRMFRGCYYTRCALIRSDGRLYIHMQFRLKQRVFKFLRGYVSKSSAAVNRPTHDHAASL